MPLKLTQKSVKFIRSIDNRESCHVLGNEAIERSTHAEQPEAMLLSGLRPRFQQPRSFIGVHESWVIRNPVKSTRPNCFWNCLLAISFWPDAFDWTPLLTWSRLTILEDRDRKEEDWTFLSVEFFFEEACWIYPEVILFVLLWLAQGCILGLLITR